MKYYRYAIFISISLSLSLRIFSVFKGFHPLLGPGSKIWSPYQQRASTLNCVSKSTFWHVSDFSVLVREGPWSIPNLLTTWIELKTHQQTTWNVYAKSHWKLLLDLLLLDCCYWICYWPGARFPIGQGDMVLATVKNGKPELRQKVIKASSSTLKIRLN